MSGPVSSCWLRGNLKASFLRVSAILSAPQRRIGPQVNKKVGQPYPISCLRGCLAFWGWATEKIQVTKAMGNLNIVKTDVENMCWIHTAALRKTHCMPCLSFPCEKASFILALSKVWVGIWFVLQESQIERLFCYLCWSFHENVFYGVRFQPSLYTLGREKENSNSFPFLFLPPDWAKS